MAVIILDHRQPGMIREQMTEHYPDFATGQLNLDSAKDADRCGGVGIRLTRPEDPGSAVMHTIAMDRSVVIDGDTDAKRF